MSVEATSKSPSSKGSSSPRVYKGKEILDFVLDLSEYALFRPLLREDVWTANACVFWVPLVEGS